MPRGVDRYDEARVQGQLWTPTEWRGTSKLALWVKVGESSITYSTGIGQINDLSGNANHVNQAVSGNQPALDFAGWKAPGRVAPAIFYDGGNDNLGPATGLSYSGANGFSSFSAVQNIGAATYRTIHSGGSGGPQ